MHVANLITAYDIKEDDVNHSWQQPIRPLEILVPDTELWVPVLFIRPAADQGWEAITHAGVKWKSQQTSLRYVE